MAPANALDTYRRMRDFAQTPEPAGALAAANETLTFVVQKHAARSLHYDFRLELDGTLKSWAVPKGPSLDAADKRMAVHVEDHPLDYAAFEGVIPPGHYGAGQVIVWDRGTWAPVGDAHAGLRDGKLKFALHGQKLRGAWALVRMKPRDGERHEAWLLMKERDSFTRKASEYSVVEAEPDSVLGLRAVGRSTVRADANVSTKPTAASSTIAIRTTTLPIVTANSATAAFPQRLAPQLASLVDRPPEGSGWFYEIKLDGYRLLVRAHGPAVHAFTRNGIDWSARLPGVVAAVRSLALRHTWLDGEIVVDGADGVPDFQALQNAFETKRTEAIRYHLFDMPFHNGHDLRALPVEERRERLKAVLDAQAQPALRFSEAFSAEPAALLESVRRLGLEGLIGKRLGSPYRSQRSTDWIKLKARLRQEFVIGGFTDPKGTRAGLGALLLGVHGDDGALHYAGNVGSGFDARALAALRQRLGALAATTSPFADAPQHIGTRGDAAVHWVQPTLLAEVSFAQWTQAQRVRHAVFHGLRDDKPAAQITREPTVNLTRLLPAHVPACVPAPTPATRHKRVTTPTRVTHAERVIDAQSGVTKGELVAYYEQVAALMLPHLRQRPTSLLRAPAGTAGELFFQKHAQGEVPIGMARLDPALDPGHEPLLTVQTARGLAAAAQLNVVEFHTWNATLRHIDKPDRMVFDLDPGSGVAWLAVREAAQLLQAFLTELQLTSFLKTSGGKGLHVVVPLTPRHGWETVKRFAQAVVQHMARVVPSRFVAKSGPRNRVGKIYIDVLRNAFGATTACAWSARARPGLGVSVPIGWDELAGLTSATQWTVRNVGDRYAVGNQPWASCARSRQGLAAAMRALAFEPPAGAS